MRAVRSAPDLGYSTRATPKPSHKLTRRIAGRVVRWLPRAGASRAAAWPHSPRGDGRRRVGRRATRFLGTLGAARRGHVHTRGAGSGCSGLRIRPAPVLRTSWPQRAPSAAREHGAVLAPLGPRCRARAAARTHPASEPGHAATLPPTLCLCFLFPRPPAPRSASLLPEESSLLDPLPLLPPVLRRRADLRRGRGEPPPRPPPPSRRPQQRWPRQKQQ